MNWKGLKQKKLVYKTALNKDELQRKLHHITTEYRNYSNRADIRSKPLEGKIGDKSFEVSTRLEFMNFARPMIYGVINELDDGSQIDLRIEMDAVFLAFVAIWLGIVFLASLGVILYVIVTGNFSFFQIIPFIMVLFGFAAFRKAIDDEVERISKIFSDTIQAQVV